MITISSQLGDNMYDLDRILSVVENPTRRKILQAIVREPHYPLQLSKELGVSQQAIVKNLDIMEREGLVVSSRESSNRGPERLLYRPKSEFTIVIDMREGMFEAHMIPSDEENNKKEPFENKELEGVRESISDIDEHIREFDRLRSEMICRRNEIIRSFTDNVNRDEMDYTLRNLLYELLNKPNMAAEEISRDLGVNEDSVTRMIEEIEEICRTE